MSHFTRTALASGILALTTQAYAATPVVGAPVPTVTTKVSAVNVTPAERTKIEEVVHQYLVRQPEVLVEALQILQQKQYQEAEKTVKQTQQIAGGYANALFHQPNDPVVGNPNGKVTVVEFFDYQCPHCVDMAPVMEGIIKADPNVRIIFKEFPIRGPVSEFASRAALAANKQGKYYDFSHALLKAPQPLTQEIVLQTAKNVGLDMDKLKKDMEDSSVKDQLKANNDLAKSLKLFGTPALFIGKTDASTGINYIPGQMDQKQLQGAIDQLGK